MRNNRGKDQDKQISQFPFETFVCRLSAFYTDTGTDTDLKLLDLFRILKTKNFAQNSNEKILPISPFWGVYYQMKKSQHYENKK